jgi:hypothetical protein
MRAFINVLPAFAFMFPAMAQHNLTQAESDWPDLRIMRSGEVAELSPALRADLEKRGCRVPKFARWHAQHNVIRGRFADSTREDVAVLCMQATGSTCSDWQIIVIELISPRTLAVFAGPNRLSRPAGPACCHQRRMRFAQGGRLWGKPRSRRPRFSSIPSSQKGQTP